MNDVIPKQDLHVLMSVFVLLFFHRFESFPSVGDEDEPIACGTVARILEPSQSRGMKLKTFELSKITGYEEKALKMKIRLNYMFVILNAVSWLIRYPVSMK